MSKKDQAILDAMIDPVWSEELREVVEDFYYYRSEIKYPVAPRAAKRFKNLINKYRSWKHHDDDIIEAVDRSMRNNWRDVFMKEIPVDVHRDRILSGGGKYWDLYTNQERNALLL